MIPREVSDHACIKVRITLRTGDEAYAPAINNLQVGYYVPHVLAGQTDTPTISVAGATGGSAQEYRIIKAQTTDPGLAQSEAFLTFHDVSAPGVFTQADFDLFETGTLTAHPQFTFPPFPATTPAPATDHTSFDATTGATVYVTQQRSAGAIEAIDISFDVDIAAAGGPRLSREFRVAFSGI